MGERGKSSSRGALGRAHALVGRRIPIAAIELQTLIGRLRARHQVQALAVHMAGKGREGGRVRIKGLQVSELLESGGGVTHIQGDGGFPVR